MVVICPKCKTKLKVDETKLSTAGSRFKCPKCSTVLVVKKQSEQIKKTLDAAKVLVAHSNPEVLENTRTLLQDQGYKVIASTDGIDAMVKAGVLLDDETLATGDYSGPAGARRVLRLPQAEAAIIETARGGILRRGIAVCRARVAIVTNVSSDHFGESGIHDLDGLADAKLAVASVLVRDGLLLLNADDALLREKAGGLERRLGRSLAVGWFGFDSDCEALRSHRERGSPTCGVRDGSLRLTVGGIDYDLGPVSSMPLTVGGSALYNVANLAGAGLAAAALGVPAAAIAAVFRRFGASATDWKS